MDVDLARPEFDGRWDKQAIKQDIDPLFNRSKHWKTKMDKVNSLKKTMLVSIGFNVWIFFFLKEILQRTLTRLKENIVREQVVGTKRFDGPVPFKSDPVEIQFKVHRNQWFFSSPLIISFRILSLIKLIE